MRRRKRMSKATLDKYRVLALERRLWEHSTGPKTEEGKRRVSMNALKHGMFTAEAILTRDAARAVLNIG